MRSRYKFYQRKTIFEDRIAKKFKKTKVSLKKFCERQVKRIEYQKDSFILVTGPTGSGKSTLVGKFCFSFFETQINIVTGEGNMYNDGNFCVDPEVFAKLMVQRRGSVLWLDEAIDAVNRRNWNSKVNQLIISRKNRNRKLFNVYFMILPLATQVDKALSPHINFWIQCPKRKGNHVKARLFVATNDRLASNGLDVAKMIDREEKWFKENPSKAECPPTIHPEFRGYLVFKAFERKDQERYDSLVEQHKTYGDLTEEEEALETLGTQKEIEKNLKKLVKDVFDGKVKTKMELWEQAQKISGYTHAKLERELNRYLSIQGLRTFKRIDMETFYKEEEETPSIKPKIKK